MDPLKPGDKFGDRYQLLSKAGEGGMGEVWKAHDTKLDRDVALKVSKAEFTARFDREARAIAAFNHPNICQIYDVGPNYIVMEWIDGVPLTGPLPVEKAVSYAGFILDALDAAHRKGFTHRDLKPANVMVTKNGILKLLDFGLAKQGTGLGPDDVTRAALTVDGQITGTLQYMAPEQLQGKEADSRADIFAFGCVLYEMLTDRRAFDGTNAASIIAAVMERPAPSVSEVAPVALDRVVKKCLAKDPDDRWQSARDLKAVLELSMLSAGGTAGEPAPSSRSWSRHGGWIAAAALGLIAALGWTPKSPPATAVSQEVALSIVPPRGETVLPVGSFFVDRISPDGSTVLFRTGASMTSESKLYVRKLDSLAASRLPQMVWFGDSFWAPDSQAIAVPIDHNRLMKVHIPDGSPELITNEMVGALRGGSWGEKGVILFAQSTGRGAALFSVPASGGTPVRVDVPGLGNGSCLDPVFLPGGDDFLFSFVAESSDAQVYIATLRDGKAADPRMLLNNETAAAFTPAGGGRILFVRDDNLYSQKLDLRARNLSGAPQLLQEKVASNPAYRNANFSVSRTGTVVWRSGTATLSEVAIFDRNGNRKGVAGVPVSVSSIRLSPDESHLAISGGTTGSWIVEANGSGRMRLNWRIGLPLWSTDGSKLIYHEGTKLLERALSGPGESHELGALPAYATVILHGISTDGRKILFGGGQQGSFLFDLDRKEILGRALDQRADTAAMSPDGSWIVYHPLAETGLYVKPLSAAGLPRQIADTGNFPVWRSDGREILFLDPTHGVVSSIAVQGAGSKLQFTPPQLLFRASPALGLGSGSVPLAVNRDGSRIYFVQSVEQPDSGVINVRTGAMR
jgi:serine/threonine protein kinase